MYCTGRFCTAQLVCSLVSFLGVFRQSNVDGAVMAPLPYKAVPILPADGSNNAAAAQANLDAQGGVFSEAHGATYGDPGNGRITASLQGGTHVTTKRIYQGPLDPRSTFLHYDFIKARPGNTSSLFEPVDLCECNGFIFDPNGLKLQLKSFPVGKPISLVYVQPGNCAGPNNQTAGVTCQAAHQSDAASGCGATVGEKQNKKGKPITTSGSNSISSRHLLFDGPFFRMGSTEFIWLVSFLAYQLYTTHFFSTILQ